MAVILYKKGDTGIETTKCSPHDINNFLAVGWHLDPGGEHDGMFKEKENNEEEENEEPDEEKETDEKEVLSEDKEIAEHLKAQTAADNYVNDMHDDQLRYAAKDAGFDNWKKGRFATLRLQLKEFKYVGSCYQCSVGISADNDEVRTQNVTGRLFCSNDCWGAFAANEGHI